MYRLVERERRRVGTAPRALQAACLLRWAAANAIWAENAHVTHSARLRTVNAVQVCQFYSGPRAGHGDLCPHNRIRFAARPAGTARMHGTSSGSSRDGGTTVMRTLRVAATSALIPSVAPARLARSRAGARHCRRLPARAWDCARRSRGSRVNVPEPATWIEKTHRASGTASRSRAATSSSLFDATTSAEAPGVRPREAGRSVDDCAQAGEAVHGVTLPVQRRSRFVDGERAIAMTVDNVA